MVEQRRQVHQALSIRFIPTWTWAALLTLLMVLLAAMPVPAAGATEASSRSALGTLPPETLAGWDRPRLPAAGRNLAGAHAAGADRTVPGALLVTLAAPAGAARFSADLGTGALLPPATASTPGLRAATPLTGGVVGVEVSPGAEQAAAAALAALPQVSAVERVRRHEALRVPDDTHYPEQWAHQLTGVEDAWELTTGGEDVDGDDVRIAVIDSGMAGDHPELEDNLVEQVVFDDDGAEVQPLGSRTERCPGDFSHGTFVAGVLGAHGDNGLGVAGVNWRASILDLAVFSEHDSGCFTDDVRVIEAIDYAVAAGAAVINLSLGSVAPVCGTAMQDTIDRALDAGAVVVAAAGNHELVPGIAGLPAIPASCNGVVSVGAVDRHGQRSGYSATGEHLDLVAPGGDRSDGPEGVILSTGLHGGIEGQVGTSFAAPYVAGVAALVRAVNPTLSPAQVEGVLERTAHDAGDPGRDPAFGWGVVQAGEAVALAARARESDTVLADAEEDPPFPVSDDGEDITMPPPQPEVIRISAGPGPTEAITQAVAVSQALFPAGAALHAVLARADDYPDALAGSALGFGVGPLLFSHAVGPLAASTRAELQRAVPAGATVYLLGGTAALPAQLDGELAALGYVPVRLAGATREHTAAAVAGAVGDVVASLAFEPLPAVLLATRENWPDAVAAGSFASYFGVPVLLASPRGPLHPATAAALRELAPDVLYVVGGTEAISEDVLGQARAAAGTTAAGTVRLGGPERTATALHVARELEAVFADVLDTRPALAVTVNLRRGDAFAHVLSATAVAGAFPSVFMPVEGAAGDLLPAGVRAHLDGYGADGVVIGGDDLLSPEVEAELLQLLRG